MNTLHNTPAMRQGGFSKLGLLGMLVVLVAGLTFGLKVLPVYIDHNFVHGVADELVESGRVNSMTQAELREEIAASMRVNNVRDFDLNSITLSRANGSNVISIDYERRIALVANIDVVISFDDQIQ
ncbi:MAG: DUF4845 domain-containing protein [Pseudomonadales bacterium]|nr:DUF4845 domain-containing protein [Pseudomonadales bacterium]MCP5331143.1 DUF4845 domain-containing protein [Pseudomonadales bacterium]MCP5343606.1 DUF4845 domain-containing protein [Pseudomonadales bacterium]